MAYFEADSNVLKCEAEGGTLTAPPLVSPCPVDGHQVTTMLCCHKYLKSDFGGGLQQRPFTLMMFVIKA